MKSTLEHGPPQDRIVPVVLVAHEGEVKALATGHGRKEAFAVFDMETGLEVVVLGRTPSLAGGFYLCRADIRAHDFKTCGLLAEDLSQYPCFIGPPAGEIKNAFFRSCLPCGRNSGESAAQGIPEDIHILG